MNTSMRHFDVVVVGGGTAGSIAAIASARQGANTLLVERYGSLGGQSTGGMINFYNSFHNFKKEQVIGGIPYEIVNKLIERNATPGPKLDYSGLTGSLVIFNQKELELLLFELVEQSGAHMLLQSYLYDVVKDNDRLQAVCVTNKSGKMIITADVFIDATGDADVAALCGVPYEQTDKNLVQPSTLEIRVGGVDSNKVRQYICDHPDFFELEMIEPQEIFNQPYIVQWAKGIPQLKKWDDEGKLKYGLTYNQIWFNTHEPELSRGIFTLNATRIANIDGTNADDLTKAEIMGRKEIPILISFFKENVPGFENAYLLDIASQMGVRETRRIIGDYVITKDDVINGTRKADAIAKAVAQIDIHGSDDTSHGKKFFWTKLAKNEDRSYSYDIPYRAVLPKGVNNLLVAGRSISATREANGSVRFMPPCMAVGEATGVAAAMISKKRINTRDLDVSELQEKLKKQGVIL